MFAALCLRRPAWTCVTHQVWKSHLKQNREMAKWRIGKAKTLMGHVQRRCESNLQQTSQRCSEENCTHLRSEWFSACGSFVLWPSVPRNCFFGSRFTVRLNTSYWPHPEPENRSNNKHCCYRGCMRALSPFSLLTLAVWNCTALLPGDHNDECCHAETFQNRSIIMLIKRCRPRAGMFSKNYVKKNYGCSRTRLLPITAWPLT